MTQQAPRGLRGIWRAKLTHLGGIRWEVDITKGALRYGPDGAPFVKWGEQRARRFAIRTITKLTLQDERRERAEQIHL